MLDSRRFLRVLLGMTLLWTCGCPKAPPPPEKTPEIQEVPPVELDSSPPQSAQPPPNQSLVPSNDSGASATSPAESLPSETAVKTDPNTKPMPAESEASPPETSSIKMPEPKSAADAETEAEEPEHPFFKQLAESFPDDPPGAKRMLNSKNERLWVNVKEGEVIVDGYVSLQRGFLELFACSSGTKEHEAVVGLFAPARFMHAALLAVNATPGHPVIYQPDFLPATGQRIECEVNWKDENGKLQKINAKEWVRNVNTKEALDIDWVFAGSGWWQDEQTKEDFYMADSGDVICVSNFTTSMLDLPIASSADNDSLNYEAFEGRIPPRGTPIRLVMRPLPLNTPKSDTPATETQEPKKAVDAAETNSTETTPPAPTTEQKPEKEAPPAAPPSDLPANPDSP